MGFGNYIPFIQKDPPDPTFGELRDDLLGVTVECRKCRHASYISPKASRFLKERLPDGLKLREAVNLFRCSSCNHNRVTLEPETAWEQVRRMRERDPYA